MSTMTEFNNKVIDEFRTNGGKVGGQMAGSPMVLLTYHDGCLGAPAKDAISNGPV